MMVSRIGGGSGGWASVLLWCILLLAGVVGFTRLCHAASNINRVIESSSVTLLGHIARTKETALANKILVGNSEGKVQFCV